MFLELTSATQKVLQQIQSLGVASPWTISAPAIRRSAICAAPISTRSRSTAASSRRSRPQDAESTAIIRAVVALAGSLGMKTVAEGVSTEEQLQLVRALGCDKIQGYIFSRPVTGTTVRAMLGQNRKLAAA